MLKNNVLLIKLLATSTYLGVIVINFLANFIPINQITTGQVSNSYRNLFAPAGLTFSIWGLIYLLLAAYVVYQFGFFQKNEIGNKDKIFTRIGIYFSFTSIDNITWIFAWHYNLIGISLLAMAVILFLLIKIANELSQKNFSSKDKFFICLPFRVYFGWITVATIANITVFLVSIGWGGFGIPNYIWTVIVLLVGAIIGIWRMFKDKSIAYGLVFVWAYLGILIKHLSSDGFDGKYTSVIVTTIVCLISFLLALFFLIKKQSQKKEKMMIFR